MAISPSGKYPEPDTKSLDSKLLVVIGSTLVISIIGIALLLADYFYPVVALLSICLVITYMLLFPVRLVEKAIDWASSQLHKTRWISKPLSHTPEASPRILAVILVYFIFLMTISIGVLRYVPLLSQDIRGFGDALSDYFAQSTSQVIDWADQTFGAQNVRHFFAQPVNNRQWQAHITHEEKTIIQKTLIETTTDKGLDFIIKGVNSAILHMTDLATTTVTGFIYCISGFLLIFYFLLDGKRLSEEIIQISPSASRKTTAFFLTRFHQVMDAFIRGQVLLGICTGIYMFIVYSCFGVPYAIFLGAFMALAECLPVVGTWLGITPAIIVMLFTFGPLKTAFIWLFSYAYQTIKDNIIAPKIVGDTMGLHPLVVILSLLVCAQFAGFLGILLALPLASILKVILQYFNQSDSEKLDLATPQDKS